MIRFISHLEIKICGQRVWNWRGGSSRWKDHNSHYLALRSELSEIEVQHSCLFFDPFLPNSSWVLSTTFILDSKIMTIKKNKAKTIHKAQCLSWG